MNSLGKQEKFFNKASYFTFIALSILVILTFLQYGITWDELYQHTYGKLLLKYYTSFFHDTSYNEYMHMFAYGGLFEIIAEIGRSILFFLGQYEAGHLINAICGLLGIIGCYKIARYVSGPTAAFFSLILVATMPTYYGHMFNNSKDIPFAVAYIWSLYYILRTNSQYPKVTLRHSLKLGLAIGATMGIRVGGLTLWIILSFSIVMFLATNIFEEKNIKQTLGYAWRILKFTLLSFVIAYGIMLIFWPWALQNPIERPISALQSFSKFENLLTPYYYLPLFLLIKLPEIMVIMIITGFFIMLSNIIRKKIDKSKATQISILIFSFLVPALYTIINRTVLYDEIRHLIFIQLPIAITAGLTLTYIFQKVTSLSKPKYYFIILLFVVYFSYHIGLMFALHPYQYVYYNQFVGGLSGASSKRFSRRRFPKDYWALSYREAVKGLTDYLKNSDEDDFYKRSYVVKSVGPSWCGTYFYPDNIISPISDTEKNIDFYIIMTREGLHDQYKGKEIFVVKRLGVPLCYVKAAVKSNK